MNGTRLKLNFFVLVFLLGCFCYSSCTGEKTSTLISNAQEKAARFGDQAKMQTIKSAAHAYALDFGERPKTLDDLVEKGYLDPSGIVDHKGDKLPFSPEAILPDFTATQSYVTKSCGNCGATVDPNSKAGDRCPYCGVVWGVERQRD